MIDLLRIHGDDAIGGAIAHSIHHFQFISQSISVALIDQHRKYAR